MDRLHPRDALWQKFRRLEGNKGRLYRDDFDALMDEVESVRSEVLVELLTYADSFAAHDEGLHLAPENWNHMRELIYALSPARVAEGMVETLQARVAQWMQSCFGPRISSDKTERNHRFLEEALELVQANGCTKSEAHQLVDYVFGRSVGDPHQECGGVLITLAALCSASGLDMEKAGEDELARIWQKIELIRAKQAAKPPHSPLPSAPESPAKEQPGEQIAAPLNVALSHGQNNRSSSEAVAAPDVASMVRRLRARADRLLQGMPTERDHNDALIMAQAAALLAKLGQGWIPEPVAWRREWDGDVSDIGAMLYASSPDELDEPLSRWQPLYAREPESE